MSDHPPPSLSEAQLTAFTEAFQLFDRDGDGRIASLDLGLVMRSLGRTPSEGELSQLLADLVPEASTPTASSQLDFATFLTAMARTMKSGSVEEETLLEAFSIFDKTGSGSIPEAELCHVMGHLGERLSASELASLSQEFACNGAFDYGKMVKTLVAEEEASSRLSERVKKEFE